jgi:hypothetical protein
MCGITSTTVKNLHYDIYSATCAAKRGVSTVIDYEHYERSDGGQNRPCLFDKKTRQATPLIERDGMLEIPVHLFLLSEKRPARSADWAHGWWGL